ncbi:MAG: amidohydrolase family protein [Patescibacteria group bacterium]|nr:amidohydrolase family protein [Patescibacteria group bacterium]
MYSLLIKNCQLVDGTGEPSRKADVAIQGDKIVNIDQSINIEAESVIDAGGKVLAPGFVDLQNHSDSYWQVFDNPRFDSLVTQGFTSIVIGNCGASLAPLLSHDALLSVQKWHNLEGANINWQSFSEYIEELSRHRFACNVASLVGYSTLRRGIVGDQVRSLEKEELAALKKFLSESIDAGAFGMSSGLSYSHEIIISEIELYELAKILTQKKALFSIHLRSEGSEVSEAVEESLDIARSTEVNLKISHFKVRNENNWQKFEEVIQKIENAYHKGYNVHFDAYPYTAIWQPLYAYLPRWAIEGGRQVMLKHFENPIQKNKILSYLNNLNVKFPSMLVASTANKLNFMGKTIGQIAKNMEVSSEQAVLHIIQNGGSEVLVFEESLNPDQVKQAIFHPLSFVATDGGGFPETVKDKLVHPRCFGSAPKFLNMALAENAMPLEKAIKKLTSGPAAKIGLKKRGEIKIGNFADLVIFDPAKIGSQASYQNPYQFSQGIDYVFVNGKPALAEGKLTSQLPGYVLRKS